MIIVYVVAPVLDSMLRRITGKILLPVCLALLFLFLSDLAFSSAVPNTGKGVTSPEPTALAPLPKICCTMEKIMKG